MDGNGNDDVNNNNDDDNSCVPTVTYVPTVQQCILIKCVNYALTLNKKRHFIVTICANFLNLLRSFIVSEIIISV